MDIRDIRALKENAQWALRRGREPKKVITAYACAITITAVILAVADYWLDQQIAGAGGLSNIGTRAILSTVQTVLPLVQQLVLMAVNFGYLHALLRIARGQYADHTDLKVGFQKLMPMLRLTLLQGLIVAGIGFALFYLSIQIYLFTPWADPLMTLLNDVLASGGALDDSVLASAGGMLIPVYIIFGLLYLAVITPILYRLRMANCALADNTQAGAFAALRASRRMMRGHCLQLLKLDFSFWWYYLLDALVVVLCYGDVILAMAGIQLPIHATVSYFLFYALYLGALFVMNYFLRNRVETTYVMAYEALHEKPKDDGVVLGNIFDV